MQPNSRFRLPIDSPVSEKRRPIFKCLLSAAVAFTGIILPPLLLPTLTVWGDNIRDVMITQDYRMPLSHREVKSICQAMFGYPTAHGTICFTATELQKEFQSYSVQSMYFYQTLPRDRRITIISNKFVAAKCYGYQTDLTVYSPCLKFSTNTPMKGHDVVVVQFSQGELSPVQQAEASRTTAPFIAVSGYLNKYDAMLNIVRLTDGKLEQPVTSVSDAVAAATYSVSHNIDPK